MHKLFSAIAISTLLASSAAYAGPPKKIINTDIVTMQPGEPLTYMFDEHVDRISVGVEGVVLITAQTDQIFTLQGVAPGEAFVVAQDKNGSVIHKMTVIVVGHSLQLYHGAHQIMHRCAATGCTAIDPDEGKQVSKSVRVVKPTQGGGFVETTKDYK